jgi:hypothetical protein
MSFLLTDCESVASRFPRRARLAAAALFLCWPALGVCQPQAQSVLCRGGNGNFDAEFRTGVKVHVGAGRDGGLATLATRACAAKLSWEKQELLVATGAAQLDLDAFGVDFGDGVPVAAFQIKKSDSDCCMDYAIYSLEKPPRLLRTITGGEFFSASDMNLDGNVEIWTNDAAAVNGFENLTLGELDSAPTAILGFAHGQLRDVSAEFQSYFDNEIARMRSGIQPHDLEDFKNSDGKLQEIPTPVSTERLHRLRAVKIRVLEVVWAYLYSGRDQEAWRFLAEMWPQVDADRIRAALMKARAVGIRSQADGASVVRREGKKKPARIFDAVSRSGRSRRLEIIPPKAILLELLPISEIQQPGPPLTELLLDLVIDEAGKVRSAEPAGNAKWADPDRIKSALTWKFIPGFKDDRAVASRLRLAVSPRQ